MAVSVGDKDVIYYLRDLNTDIVTEWKSKFENYSDNVKPSEGDIFVGAPAADAIVCPTNSFVNGVGNIEQVLMKHYGQGIYEQLKEVIENEYDGEILVGQAVVLSGLDRTKRNAASSWTTMNDGDFIRFLICAPTMRVPQTTNAIPNAYLAFRAVILAVREHNRKNKSDQISRVLVPGLGTAAGRMPPKRCAKQMLEAYETHVVGLPSKHFRLRPTTQDEMIKDHAYLCKDD